MYTPSQLEKMMFIDIETAGNTATSSELSQKMQELWSARSEILRGHLGDKYPDNKGKTDEDLFQAKSALQAEFGRIISITIGLIKFVDGEPTANLASYSGDDEVEILTNLFRVISKMEKTGINVVGHNIKRFDIPFICKRAFINKVSIPPTLQVWGKKPWETSLIDTSELWSFGAWQEGFTGLDLLATVLGIDSPKSDINGSQVHEAYYAGEILRIEEYCQRDVVTVMQILLSLGGLNLIDKSCIRVKAK